MDAGYKSASASRIILSPSGLSTWLPLRGEEGIISAANAGTPVLQAHGDADVVVSQRRPRRCCSLCMLPHCPHKTCGAWVTSQLRTNSYNIT